jgi:hypothetical protein
MNYEPPLLAKTFSMIVSGPSKAGKTVFVSNLVKTCRELFEEVPAEIIWCYAEYQPAYNELTSLVRFVEGLPNLKELKQGRLHPKLIIFDDMMDRFQNDPSLTTLFIKGSHHWNLSCVHIVQNLYFNGMRTARINTNYLVLFKNPSDKLQVANLGRQLFPGKTKYFMDAFELATCQPYSYLLLDLTQTCPENLRLHSNIFPGETQAVYVPT